MKISGFAFLSLALTGCTVLAGTSDFEVLDGGTGSDAQPDVNRDGGEDTHDSGPELQCMNDMDCNATNGTATCSAAGTCLLTCLDGFGDCDGEFSNGCEVDLSTSLDNCGSCGDVCNFEQANETCEAGMCNFAGCQEGFGDCNMNLIADGCEASLLQASACGSCDNVCEGATPLCDRRDGGVLCVPSCIEPDEECEGRCVDITTDPMNCSMCGAADCVAPTNAVATCEASMCSFACDAGRGDCNDMEEDGCEVDTNSSVEHCGTCGEACEGMNAVWTCDSSICAIDRCESDQFQDCDMTDATGCEVDLMNDPMNCGGCGDVCEGVCQNGYCDPIVDVEGRASHVCLRRLSGQMMCWGINFAGQLGNGSFTPSVLPMLVLDPEAAGVEPFLVQDIAVGERSTCAIDDAGEIWCWGGSAGSATGLTANTTVPQRLNGGAAYSARVFTQIAGGDRSYCALDDEQHIWCWGNNGNSQLGIGRAGGAVAEPERVAGLDTMPLDEEFSQVVYGNLHGCGLLVDNTVRCWGRNNRGQAGIGAVGEADRAWDVGLSDIVELAAGNDHTCAVDTMGAMHCWGINDNGQFGNGMIAQSNAPVMTLVSGVSNLSAGLEHTCASVDGQPHCWGRGDDGELGTGARVDSRVPVELTDVSSTATLIAVYNYSCAIDGGRLSCWGSNARGTLGREPTILRTEPTMLSGLGMITTGISIEQEHACAISDSIVYCWGIDTGNFGRLGGAPIGAVPTSIRPADSVHAVVNGTVINTGAGPFGFGFSSAGRIDAGSGPRLTPTAMGFTGTVDEVGMGTSFSCARQGAVVNCRGYNGRGQLGRGTISDTTDDGPAQPVVGLLASQLSVAPLYSCATDVGGQVVCWGDNENGQLGNSSMTDSGTPVAIAPLDDTIMVSAGQNHACAIQRASPGDTSGQVWCWGRNSERQTGAMDFGQRVAPSEVFGLFDATSVAAYSTHSCAIRSGGQMVCWGSNQNYELGDGTTTDSRVPVDVVGLTDAAALGTSGIGSWATCATRSDGDALCWGGCWDGVCGTGEALVRLDSALVGGL